MQSSHARWKWLATILHIQWSFANCRLHDAAVGELHSMNCTCCIKSMPSIKAPASLSLFMLWFILPIPVSYSMSVYHDIGWWLAMPHQQYTWIKLSYLSKFLFFSNSINSNTHEVCMLRVCQSCNVNFWTRNWDRRGLCKSSPSLERSISEEPLREFIILSRGKKIYTCARKTAREGSESNERTKKILNDEERTKTKEFVLVYFLPVPLFALSLSLSLSLTQHDGLLACV